MASKPKSKTFIVLQCGGYKQPNYIGRYRIGARNEDEAAEFLKEKLGKHVSVKVYYEEKINIVPYGVIERE